MIAAAAEITRMSFICIAFRMRSHSAIASDGRRRS
jgi:hypothetical protein